MARPKKDASIDLSEAQELTVGIIERLTCQPGKLQTFLRDKKAPGLRVRATPASTKNPQGVKAFVFEAKLNRQTIRRTIGDVRSWTIEAARFEANRLRVTFDAGMDPREVDREKEVVRVAEQAAIAAQSVTFGEAWQAYLKERKPHWGTTHYGDHVKMAQLGGDVRKRRKGVLTMAGPLAHFMPKRLAEVNSVAIHEWAQLEAKMRPTRLRLALRQLKAFLRWCAGEPAYKISADPSAASSKKTREVSGAPKTKNDYLQREQLQAWFTHVRGIPNLVVATYLQCLLLTGPRREELAELEWEHLDFNWNGISLKDKMEGTRQVPMTPYVRQLLLALPRTSKWVFPSSTSASGHLTEPSIAHRKACASAGLKLTLHGLRRSFASLCEWLDIPGGISAQIQGHAPQGVREQNYIRRPLDLLRVHHVKIEAWILQQAGIMIEVEAVPGELRVVTD